MSWEEIVKTPKNIHGYDVSAIREIVEETLDNARSKGEKNVTVSRELLHYVWQILREVEEMEE